MEFPWILLVGYNFLKIDDDLKTILYFILDVFFIIFVYEKKFSFFLR